MQAHMRTMGEDVRKGKANNFVLILPDKIRSASLNRVRKKMRCQWLKVQEPQL
jgi:phosphoketolase